MNRIKAADITQLRYFFDMYYCVFYNKNIIENPESIFSFLSSVGKKYGTKDKAKKLKLSTCYVPPPVILTYVILTYVILTFGSVCLGSYLRHSYPGQLYIALFLHTLSDSLTL